MSETESHRGLSFLHRSWSEYTLSSAFSDASIADLGSDLRRLMAGSLGFCRRCPQDGASPVGACTYGICFSLCTVPSLRRYFVAPTGILSVRIAPLLTPTSGFLNSGVRYIIHSPLVAHKLSGNILHFLKKSSTPDLSFSSALHPTPALQRVLIGCGAHFSSLATKTSQNPVNPPHFRRFSTQCLPPIHQDGPNPLYRKRQAKTSKSYTCSKSGERCISEASA